jgi:hypothetical protein
VLCNPTFPDGDDRSSGGQSSSHLTLIATGASVRVRIDLEGFRPGPRPDLVEHEPPFRRHRGRFRERPAAFAWLGLMPCRYVDDSVTLHVVAGAVPDCWTTAAADRL